MRRPDGMVRRGEHAVIPLALHLSNLDRPSTFAGLDALDAPVHVSRIVIER